ncbi:MAG: hypothetical protein GXO33_06305 [Epsilonproteobacteria bacterium]|nr:hypothetical protein [Campylobacterota bacterium]
MESNTTTSFAQQLPDLPYLNMGSGFLIGLAVGYFLKKSFKILLFLMGAAIALTFALSQIHVVELHPDQLEHTVTTGSGYFKQFALFLKDRLSAFGAAGSGSAVAGFFVGLKMG